MASVENFHQGAKRCLARVNGFHGAQRDEFAIGVEENRDVRQARHGRVINYGGEVAVEGHEQLRSESFFNVPKMPAGNQAQSECRLLMAQRCSST
jgi:hypothetical protein